LMYGDIRRFFFAKPCGVLPHRISSRRNSFGWRFQDTWFNEAHVPSIGIALIDRDDAAMHFMRPASSEGDCDRELGKAITTVALDVHFHDFAWLRAPEAKRFA
jgi:hypothetical protein